MSDELVRKSIVDDEHLKLLSLGYMISAGISAFFSLFGLMYMAMGILMGAAISHFPVAGNTGGPPPAFVGWIFGGIGFVIFVLMILMAALKFRVAICIKNRMSRTFCMVVAGISCLGIPYGTILGVLTLVVLERESVTRMFSSGVVSQ
jgi:hypothetical protein